MGAEQEPRNPGGSTAVEFVDGTTWVAGGPPVRPWSRWHAAAVIGLVAALYLGLLVAPGSEEVTQGRLHNIGVHFGDPFDIEWVELIGPPDQEQAASGSRPIPMAGVHPPCVGFARPDWPSDSRHPTVARCINADDLDRLDGYGVVGVWRIVTGVETWYFFFFAENIADLEAVAADGSPIDADRIHLRDRFAAVLLPTGSTGTTLTWRLRPGGPFGCKLDWHPSGELVCGL